MAKASSILGLKGTIGGINFYTTGGKTYARAKSSLTKEKVMNDPAFARSREQMSEFGAAAALGSTLRSIWSPFRKRAADSRIAGRLNAQLLKTLSGAPGLRGQRGFVLRDHADQLLGFRLRKQLYMSSIVDEPVFNVSADHRSLEISFAPWAEVKQVKGATHYRLIAAMGLISDWLHDDDEKRYIAVNNNHHGIAVHLESNIQALGTPPATATLELPPNLTPDTTDSLLAVWGIEYLQEVNGKWETLYENSAMEIGWIG